MHIYIYIERERYVYIYIYTYIYIYISVRQAAGRLRPDAAAALGALAGGVFRHIDLCIYIYIYIHIHIHIYIYNSNTNNTNSNIYRERTGVCLLHACHILPFQPIQ